MSDWGAAELTAGGGFLALVGAGLKWLVTWICGRQDKRIAALEREMRATTATVFMLGAVLTEVMHELPSDSPSRKRAERALKKAFPVDPGLPPDMAAMVDRIRGAEA